MAHCGCFSGLVRKNKKYKRKERFQKAAKEQAPVGCPIESSANMDSSTTFVPGDMCGETKKNAKEMSEEISLRGEVKEAEYEGEDESLSVNRDSFGHLPNKNEEFDRHYSFNCRSSSSSTSSSSINDKYQKKPEEVTETGNMSDPGIGKRESWSCTVLLKRSCSDLARRKLKRMSFEPKFESYEGGSPVSSHCSADKVMLKKHSSSHILPSRSRKLWWKLFLWSHRNVKGGTSSKSQPHEPIPVIVSKQGGYSSDTLESAGQGMDYLKSLASLPKKSLVKVRPLNQWVACPVLSFTLLRVDEWVKELSTPFIEDLQRPCLDKLMTTNTPDEVIHANHVIHSLNSSSTVAHIAGTGLKLNPILSHFSSLRSINLSNNSIVQITPGSLPKGLHILNLSRNQIHTIEGLKELTRLRVLDLSYNRISRIGRGLSHSTHIKELYLSGNKISYVEGLHRLVKLKVVDLSFNKITTTDALRQLVANYNSLISINLLGNPIHSISDAQLRKTVCSLVRKLVYLNKEAINQQKAREQAVAEAVLGDNVSWSSRRRKTRKTNLGNSASFRRNNMHDDQKMKHKMTNQTQRQSYHQS